MSDSEISSNKGHRERLRTRYLQSGDNGLPDYDLLELLLTYAVQRRDVKSIARELIERFHDLQGVIDAGADQLCQIKGIGPNSAILITLIRSHCTRYLETSAKNCDVINSTEKLREYARMRLALYSDEVFLLICLDVKNQILNTTVYGRGTVDSVVIHPRIIAEEALRNKAASVILVHNHPSGQTEPSRADADFTAKLEVALRPLEIVLLDHLVVSRYGYFSFLDHNMLKVRYAGGNRQ